MSSFSVLRDCPSRWYDLGTTNLVPRAFPLVEAQPLPGPVSATPLFLFTYGDVINYIARNMRREDNRWLGWNADYKYHSKDTHFRWKIEWRLELLGALRFMGVTASLRWKEKVKVNQLSRQATRDKKKSTILTK